MKILHVTPHLGGGVGKAHAALRNALPKQVEQTFVLLEKPRDRRYADVIEAGGAQVVVAAEAGGLRGVAEFARAADIVQFEFWNHPRMFEYLARCDFSAMRSVFWSHISGLAPPVIQPALIEQSARFVFTTEASRGNPSVAMLPDSAQRKIRVVNSGFGFADAPQPKRTPGKAPAIAYLGTVDFIKMHPGFFDAVDALSGDVRVSVWGEADPSVTERAAAMRHPERIRFLGPAADPAAALSEADIFFYPLQRDHYGTAENALVEAMSLGLAPVVLDNPAEMAIVRHGETGLVARSVEDCTVLLQTLLASPDLRGMLSRNAARYAAEVLTPARSAEQFLSLWQEVIAEAPSRRDFRRAIGDTPADWFLATRCLPGETWDLSQEAQSERRSKGMLAHFRSAFPGDASLSRLADDPANSTRRAAHTKVG